MVNVEEFDELEFMEEEEFERCMAFLGAKMLRSSLADWLPLLHAGRLIGAKLGGLATAVMSG